MLHIDVCTVGGSSWISPEKAQCNLGSRARSQAAEKRSVCAGSSAARSPPSAWRHALSGGVCGNV